jgi:hypothetical protein
MLRQIIAKTVSRVKEAGAELPIISEIPLPATVLSVGGFYQPTIIDYERMSIRDIASILRELPQVAYGSVYGEAAGRWYSVTYPKPIKGAVPVAIGAARGGTIPGRTIPKVPDIPQISIERPPDIAFKEIVRITRDDFNNAAYCDRVGGGARDRAKQAIGVPWPLDAIWGWFCDNVVYWIFFAGWYVSGWILNVLWDAFVQPQIDKVRDSINSVVSDANAKINLQFDRHTTAIATAVNEANRKVNDQLKQIQDALNLRLQDLYTMWGIPTNIALTPLHIRNVTDTGFEFQSFGKTTAYWIATGKRV